MILRTFLLILCLLGTTSWATQSRLDLAGLVNLLLTQGYHDIREVALEGDKFKVTTLDRRDEEVHLIVDAYTGEIKKKEAN